MPTGSFAACAVIVGVLLGPCAEAQGQAASGEAESDEEAKALFQSGRAAVQAGRDEAAARPDLDVSEAMREETRKELMEERGASSDRSRFAALSL